MSKKHIFYIFSIRYCAGVLFCRDNARNRRFCQVDKVISRQTKIFLYSKNWIFLKNEVFLKILCQKIYADLLKHPSGSFLPNC